MNLILKPFTILENGGKDLIENNEIFNLIRNLYNESNNNLEFNNRFEYWKKLLHYDDELNLKSHKIIEIYSKILNTNIKSSEIYKITFILHTSLYIIIKKIVNKIIITEMDRLKINDILEVGVFNWYKNEYTLDSSIYNDDIYLLLYNDKIEDIFKDLYENFIPFKIRAILGEYYTPNFLIKEIYDKLEIDDINQSFIDSNCGVGLFILEILDRRLQGNNSTNNFIKKLNNIIGVDINPLSVFITKANLILNLHQYNVNPNIIKNMVYNLDLVNIPKEIIINNVKCYNLKYKNIDIIIPSKILELKNSDELLEEIVYLIKYKDIFNILNTISCYVDITNIKDDLLNSYTYLMYSDIDYFVIKDIFLNNFKICKYKNFKYIVGNPPFVRWQDLSNNYREKLKEYVLENNIFSNDINIGGNDLNLVSILTNISIKKWANKNTIISYIMPKSIMYNKSFENFRKLEINNNKLYFNKVYDFSKCKNIFSGIEKNRCM